MATLLPPEVSPLSPGIAEALDPVGSRFTGRTHARANRRLKPPPRKRPYITYALLAVILLLAAGIRCLWLNFQLDDSFITYTFARSLARGEGFSFTGPQVLGTTTPLYALLLGGLLRAGAPVDLAAKLLGLSGALGGCVLLYRLTCREMGTGGALLAAALLALNGVHASISMSGMETSLYTTVCLAALYCRSARPNITALLAACACLLRPDGLLLVGILALAQIDERRLLRASTGICFLAPLLAWLGTAFWLFGSPVPTSLTAKLAYPDYGAFSLEAALRAVGPRLGFGVFLCAFAVTGFRQRLRPLLPLVAWTVLYLLAFLRAPNFSWYYVPAVPGLIVLGVAGLCTLGRKMLAWTNRDPRRPRKLILAVQGLAATGVLTLAALDLSDQREFINRTHGPEVSGTYRGIADWLRNSTPPDATVGIPEVGYVGYFSGRKVLDLAGLCSPEVIPYLRKRAYEAVVRDFHPDYVVLTTERQRPIHNAISGSPWFQSHYVEKTRFPYRGNAYVVWERANTPAPFEVVTKPLPAR